jgi:hypothetical protein
LLKAVKSAEDGIAADDKNTNDGQKSVLGQ